VYFWSAFAQFLDGAFAILEAVDGAFDITFAMLQTY
jgi:hypothetical protein